MATRTEIPKAIQELLEELEESPEKVKTRRGSHAIILHDNQRLELSATECEKLLQSSATVERLVEATGDFDVSSIELHDVEVECDVHDALEELFDDVIDT